MTADGVPIKRFVVALYDYQAAILEEIGFCAGDTVAVLEMRPDGWWIGEVAGIKNEMMNKVMMTGIQSVLSMAMRKG